MSDPYRDSGGIACPRCGLAMAGDQTHDVVCADGCGRWIDRSIVLELVATMDLPRITHAAPHWKVTRLPPTRCLVCGTQLDDVYARVGDGDDVLTLGVCVSHGVWLEGRDRDTFVHAYSHAIDAYSKALRLRTEPTQAKLEAADRIEQLERKVRALEARIAELERRR